MEEIAVVDKLVAAGDVSEVTNGGPMGKCAMCAAPPAEGKKLRACSQCKLVWYCCKACQLADWKRGHKKACKALQETSSLGGTASEKKHEARPWLQKIDDASFSMDWPPNVIFQSASAAARRTLARTPELRGPRSSLITMVNIGVVPLAKAGEDRSPMALLNNAVGPKLQREIQQLGSAAGGAAGAQPQHLEMASALSVGLLNIVRVFDVTCAAKTKARLLARGVKTKGKRSRGVVAAAGAAQGVVGFVVVECGVAIEDIMAPRGSRASAPIAVLYLDAPSLEYYIRQRYDENHGARDPDNARRAAEHMIKQLSNHVAKNGAAHLVWLTFYKHKEPPYYFGGSMMAQLASDERTVEAFGALMGLVLADTTPHAMEGAQACELMLELNKEVPVITEARFFDCDQENFRVMTGDSDAIEGALLSNSTPAISSVFCADDSKSSGDGRGGGGGGGESGGGKGSTSPHPYDAYCDESLGAASIGDLAKQFVSKHGKFLYSFAAVKLEQHGPGALFVLGKLNMRDLLSPTPPPEPFDGVAMDRMVTVVWVGPAKGSAAAAARGNKRPPIVSFDRFHRELTSHMKSLPQHMDRCSMKAGVPLAFVGNPTGSHMGLGLSIYCRKPKITDKKLEEIYFNPKTSESWVMFPGIFFDLGPGAPCGYEEVYHESLMEGEMYRDVDVSCLNLDRDVSDPTSWKI